MRHTVWRLTVLAACLLAFLPLLRDTIIPQHSSSSSTSSTVPPAYIPPLPRVFNSRLERLEYTRSRFWNTSTSPSNPLLLLGQKTARDFGVYRWAFGVHHFRVAAPPAGVLLLGDEPESQPAALGIGALLCHSLFLSNCVRPRNRRVAAARDQAAVFSRLRGMKINRVAGVRQVLSTKDGLCQTLRASGLSPGAMWRFSFPCWVLPSDGPMLASQLVQHASEMPTAWIVKPARGSHGMGIRVLNSTSDLSSKLLAPTFLRALRAPLVVTPYLREPLLHNGRKWDVRTYVLATSVLPMRLYMFSEAIVRYAAASTYSPTSTDDGSVLTNTWVGQRLLQRGVSSITGSLANLCRLPTPHDADGNNGTTDAEEVGRCSVEMADAMRDAIGRLFLAAEPRIRQVYREQYARAADGASDDEGEGGTGGDASFRCAECYHLFGVDLIADSSRRMHVIEVNVAPDLSLSTQGAACDGEHASKNCTDGSTAYDHTKLAAAYNTVRLVYSRQAVAQRLERLIERHAKEISELHLLVVPPTTTQVGATTITPPPILQQDVAEYLLDVLRETPASGCFAPVYPSLRHHAAHGKQLELMASSRPASCDEPRSPDGTEAAAQRGVMCSSYERRLQMHTLIGIVLQDLEHGDGASSFRERCERMLSDVPSGREGSWARRTHIFEKVVDLPS